MLDARARVMAVNHGDTRGGVPLQVTDVTRSGIGQRIALTVPMTSNLPVAGTAMKTESSQATRELFGVGMGEVVPTEASDRDFASVLAEVVGGIRSRAAATSTPPAASAKLAELVSPSFAPRELLERALIAEDAARWLAAPMVYRAIDAYRELMNVSA